MLEPVGNFQDTHIQWGYLSAILDSHWLAQV